MKALHTGNSAAVLATAALMLIGSGCATKKHVRQVVGPVEARVGSVEKKTADQASAIGELENNVSRVDERAIEADKKAQAAGQAAQTAQQRADAAQNRANEAAQSADKANQMAESTRSRIGTVVENLDNYKLVSTENVLFKVNKYDLTKDAKAQLDSAIDKIHSSKNYVLEVQGYTDKTGAAASNLTLSQKRADSVVRYLTMQHNVPLRKISVLGVGADDPNADNKTRDGRKQARRVEIKVFALDLENASKTTATAQ